MIHHFSLSTLTNPPFLPYKKQTKKPVKGPSLPPVLPGKHLAHPGGFPVGTAQGKMDIENVSAFRRRILSTSVRLVNSGNSVAEFAVTGVAFLWHQVWQKRKNPDLRTWGFGDTEMWNL